jgi:simple sugar transport system substrate-binding protein
MARLPKRSVALATATLTLAGVFAAPGTSAFASQKPDSKVANAASQPTVYMVGSVTNNTFWAAVQKGFLAGGKAFGVHAIYEAPGVHSSASAIPLIQAALAAKPAGIAINYTDKSIQAVTLQALHQGAKVVLYNNNLFQAFGGKANTATTNTAITGLAYVGENAYNHAVTLATDLLPHLKSHTTVLIVDPVPGVEVLALRRQGLESVFHAHGIKTEYLPAGLDETSNFTLIGSYLAAHPEIGGIVGLGDPTGDPAAEYVQQHHLNIPVAAFDVDAEAIHYIQAGVMTDATDQEPYLQGYISAENLALMILDHLYPVTVDISNYVVDNSNVADVAAASKAGLD